MVLLYNPKNAYDMDSIGSERFACTIRVSSKWFGHHFEKKKIVTCIVYLLASMGFVRGYLQMFHCRYWLNIKYFDTGCYFSTFFTKGASLFNVGSI